MKAYLIIFGISLFLLLSVHIAEGQKPAVTINEKALAVIYVDDGDHGLIAAGNGFAVDSGGIIATSSSIVRGYSGTGSDSLFVKVMDAYYETRDVTSRGDISFLKIPAEGLSYLTLEDEHVFREGEKITVIGVHSGIKLENLNGRITGILKDGDVMRTDIPISGGLEGSPVIGAGGEVIGIASLSVIGGQNFNLVVPARIIANLLEEYKNKRRPEEIGTTPEGAAGKSAAELEAELEKAMAEVSENPESARAHVMLAWTYTQLGMYKEAAEAYQEAITLRPDLVETYINLGVLFGKYLLMYDDAIRTFSKAIEIEPSNPDAHFNLAIVYLILEDRESAVEEYEILKNVSPGMAEKLYELIYE